MLISKGFVISKTIGTSNVTLARQGVLITRFYCTGLPSELVLVRSCPSWRIVVAQRMVSGPAVQDTAWCQGVWNSNQMSPGKVSSWAVISYSSAQTLLDKWNINVGLTGWEDFERDSARQWDLVNLMTTEKRRITRWTWDRRLDTVEPNP